MVHNYKVICPLIVWQFETAFKQSGQMESLRKLIDPRLGDNFPLDSISKVYQSLDQFNGKKVSL